MWKKISVFALVVFLTSVFSIVQPAEIERGYNEESEKIQYVMQPFSNSSSYEEWNVTLGGGYIDIGYDIQQTSDGGYIIVGYTRSYGDTSGRNIWLVKTDGSGIEEWNKTFGGNDDDEGHSVRQTTDGGYILTGHTESFGSNMNDVILIKTDASGNEEWMKIFGGEYDDEGYSVRQTTDGGYIIAGVTTSFATGGRDAWLIKTNASGNEEWSETYGGLSSDGARSVQQTSDGGYIMTGWTASYSAGYLFDIWLVKTDGSGNEEWNNNWGGTGVEADVGYSVKQTADGGYILTGETQSFGGDNYDAILIKTDVFGDEEWMRTFVGTFREYGRDVQQTTDGGYIVVGYTVTYGAGSDDVWVIRTDSLGNELYNDTYGGTSSDVAYAVQQTTDGRYIVIGHTLSYGAGVHDVWLIKIAELLDDMYLEITNISATPRVQETPGWVNISCSVLSSSDINTVIINVTKLDNTYVNQSMSHVEGSDVFYFNMSYSLNGTYAYYIWVTSDDEQKKSFIFHFHIGSGFIDIAFLPGWNLITIPVETNWTSLDIIANISGCLMVSWFDAVDQTFKTSTGSGYVFPVEPGLGYFVYVTTESIYSVVGLPILNVSIPLEVGWNMIGWYQAYDTNSSNLMSTISGCLMVSWFDAVNQTYKTSTGPGYVFDITRGMGLFSYVNESSIWYGDG